jgi:hypothetical protein
MRGNIMLPQVDMAYSYNLLMVPEHHLNPLPRRVAPLPLLIDHRLPPRRRLGLEVGLGPICRCLAGNSAASHLTTKPRYVGAIGPLWLSSA